MRYKNIALFCDLDQVLLRKEDAISPEDLQALERFTAEGGRFGVISDYSPATVRHYAPASYLNTWSVVLGGAEAYRFTNSTVAFPRVISQLSMAAFLRQLITEQPELSVLLYSESRVFCMSDPEVLNRRFRHGCLPFDVAGLDTALHFPWIGLRLFGPRASLEQAEQEAKRWGIHDLAECVYDEPGTCRFIPRSAGKARCLSDLRCLEDLRDMTVVAVGASEQDLGYLKEADVAIAAGDAQKAVSDAAAHRIPQGEVHAITYVIDHILPSLKAKQ